VPWLRSIFGGTEKSSSSSDIVMIITPHIVRGHELSSDDLAPIYVGTNSNFGSPARRRSSRRRRRPKSSRPWSPPGGGQPVTNPAGQGVQNPTGAGTIGTKGQTSAPPPTVNRNPNIVPVTPVGGANQPANPPATTPATPPAGARPAQLTVTPPGQMQVGSGPYTLPIQIADANQLARSR
jgi:hypothetical protein